MHNLMKFISFFLNRSSKVVIQIENQPFRYECTLNGTDDELENMWARPEKNLSDILIPQEGDSYANITVKRGEIICCYIIAFIYSILS